MRSKLMTVALLAVLLAAGTVILAGERGGQAVEGEWAPWDDQLHELGYRLYANSSINVIYGVNLTREQAVKLRDLAKEVEAAGIVRPVVNGRLAPEVVRVRETFLEIERALLARCEVAGDLEARLFAARALESELLRGGLTAPVKGEVYASCRRCHAVPGISAEGIIYDTTAKKWERMGRGARSPEVKKEMAIAHLQAILKDKKGFLLMSRMGGEVAKILTDNQKDVVGEFSCCLVPPKSMTDAVRVGQADLADWQVDMMEEVRNCPEPWWPVAKERVLDRLAKGAVAADPGMTNARVAAERKRVGDLLDKARSLSDVEFEIEKEDLAARIKPTRAGTPEHLRNFGSAFFMLMPGSTEVYDRLIRHLDQQKAEAGGLK